MAKIPEFNHPKLQGLAKLFRQLEQFSGSAGIVARQTAKGWDFSLVPDMRSLRLERRTVAVVGVPEDAPYPDQPPAPEPTIAVKPFGVYVREVQYKSLPPLAPGTQQAAVEGRLAERNILAGYEFASERFKAYPAIGFAVSDYEEFIVGEDESLDRGQTYLYAYLDDRNIWILDQPPSSASVDLVVVRNVRNDLDHFVLVQDVRLSDTDPWDGLLQPEGEAYNVNVWPHYIARDFKAFVTRQTTLTRETAVLPVVRSRGVSWLLQDLRVDLIQPRKRIRHTDCVSAFAEGR